MVKNSLWESIEKDKDKIHSFLYKRFEKYSWVGEYLEIKQASSINRLCEFIDSCGQKTIDYDTLKHWLKDLQEAKYLSLHIEPTRLRPAFIYSLLTCPSDILEDKILEYQNINKRVTDKKSVKEIRKEQKKVENQQLDFNSNERERIRKEENEQKILEARAYNLKKSRTGKGVATQ